MKKLLFLASLLSAAQMYAANDYQESEFDKFYRVLMELKTQMPENLKIAELKGEHNKPMIEVLLRETPATDAEIDVFTLDSYKYIVTVLGILNATRLCAQVASSLPPELRQANELWLKRLIESSLAIIDSITLSPEKLVPPTLEEQECLVHFVAETEKTISSDNVLAQKVLERIRTMNACIATSTGEKQMIAFSLALAFRDICSYYCL